MKTSTKVLLAVLLVLVVVFGVYAFTHQQSVEIPKPEASAGPVIDWPTLTVNGVESAYRSVAALNQASTTVCAMQAPKFATSTLQVGSVKITTGTTTALVLEISKSVSPSASTTMLSRVTVPSGGQMTLLAGSYATSSGSVAGSLGISHTGDENDLVFAPGTWLNVKYGGPNGALNVLKGSCKGIFLVN
jgi:biopolymer transport protein ExbD